MTVSKSPLAQFTTNSFVSNPIGAIAIATVAGMMLMSMGIMLHASIWLSMALLFAGIFFVYGWLAGKVTYALYEQGIQQKIDRFIPMYFGGKPKERWVYWKDIRSFRNDKDWSRRFQEYEFLKIYLKTSPGEIWINDQINKQGFAAFRDAFLAQVKIQNEKSEGESVSMSKGMSEDSRTTRPLAKEESVSKSKSKEGITQRPSFYRTIWARLITAILLILTILLVVYTAGPGQKLTHFFRINFVLIPGTIYMIYRVFVKVDD
jgi:hypothetical protein